MPRTLWSGHFSHTQNVVPSIIILKAESHTEPKEKQEPQLKARPSVEFCERHTWAPIVLLVQLSLPPVGRESSSLTLGAVLVFFSLSFAFDLNSGVLESSIWTTLSPALCCRCWRCRLFRVAEASPVMGRQKAGDSTHPAPVQLALRFPLPSQFQTCQLQLSPPVLVKCPIHCKACTCKPLPSRNLANCLP